jgi:ubiquinone/menaquinone biosynthesis C-methylase UbiE
MNDAIARPARHIDPGDILSLPGPPRRLPLRAILRALEPLSGARLLDVGCGIGSLLRAAAERGAIPAGLDRAPALLEIARWALPDADLRIGDAESIPFDTNTFDVVTAITLPHPGRDTALAELARVVRPHGRILIGHWGRSADPRPISGLRLLAEHELDHDGAVFHYLVATPREP